VTRAWEARDGRAYAAGAETMFKYILEKRGDVWRAVAGQNTRVTKPTF
jgi:hypothetical protein